MATFTDRPGFSSFQRSSRSISSRVGTRWHHISELARGNVSGNEREIGAGRRADPDHPAAEGLALKASTFNSAAFPGLTPSSKSLFEIHGHIHQIGVVHAEDGIARPRIIAQVPPLLGDNGVEGATTLVYARLT